jgi:hypothetical protein
MVGPIFVYFAHLLQFRRWFAVIKCQFSGLGRISGIASRWERRPGYVFCLRHSEVLVSSCLPLLRRELPVVREMRRLSAWRLEAEVRQEAASLVLRAFVSSAAS